MPLSPPSVAPQLSNLIIYEGHKTINMLAEQKETTLKPKLPLQRRTKNITNA